MEFIWVKIIPGRGEIVMAKKGKGCESLDKEERIRRITKVYNALIKMFPKDFNAELGNYISDPYRVLIATILSQRTRDEVTHIVAERFFRIYSSIEALAKADVKDVENIIKPVGFYRNKAPKIIEVARIILDKYGGKVPQKIDDLLKLPGVGRKTANCVLVYGYKIPAIAVDTHVFRLTNMWCIVNTKTPEETEKALQNLLPKYMWLRINDLLVRFGQTVCRPLKHDCAICPEDIASWCPEYKN